MTVPGSLAWFARHELRLSWRDWMSMMTAGKRGRERAVILAFLVFAGFMHLLAYAVVGPALRAGITPDKATLALVTGGALLSLFL